MSPSKKPVKMTFLRDPSAIDYRLPEPLEQVAAEWEGRGKQAYPCLGLRLGVSWGFQVFNRFQLDFEFKGHDKDGLPSYDCSSLELQTFEDNTGQTVKYIDIHPPEHWINGLPIIKINLPFWIQTSPGYGVWVKGLPNIANENFNVIEGFIEADTKKAFFPYRVILELKGYSSFSIKAQEPIAQYVPFPMYTDVGYEQRDLNAKEMKDAYQAHTSVSLEKGFYKAHAAVQKCPLHMDGNPVKVDDVKSEPMDDPNANW